MANLKQVVITIAKIAYHLAWLCLVIAITVTLVSLPFLMNWMEGVDDDAIFLVGISAGLLFFYPISSRLLRFRMIHWFNAIAGLIGVVATSILATGKFADSSALSGVTGPFSGLGEALSGYALLLAGALCAAAAIAGVMGLFLAFTVRGIATGHASDGNGPA